MRMHLGTRAASITAVIGVIVVLGGCGGSSQSGAQRVQRHDEFVGAPACVAGETVERDPSTRQYRCVAPNPAQPVSATSDVQQGDPCDDFGATTYNKQGLIFDCEPWGPNEGLRWILP
ncbi:MAG: hypothetical protein U0W40_05565 [Acidimicrobiia bacterium]